MNNEDKILSMLETLTQNQAETNDRLKNIEYDIAIVKAVQNRHSYQIEKIVRYVDAQTKVTVAHDDRISELERLAGNT